MIPLLMAVELLIVQAALGLAQEYGNHEGARTEDAAGKDAPKAATDGASSDKRVVAGKVKAVRSGELVVEDAGSGVVPFRTDSNTKYQWNGAPVAASTVTPGSTVRVRYETIGSDFLAREVNVTSSGGGRAGAQQAEAGAPRQHAEHGAMSGHEMTGMYGPHPMEREASGTSWQPDSTPMYGIHSMKKGWMLMLHGFGDLVYDEQGGPRGDSKVFAPTMIMFMAQRRLGPGTLGVRSMLSTDPATVGKTGYPLLLQTGETADGKPLIDRQHPHDFFMEMAASYSIPFAGHGSVFAYFGLPGEPALGPPTFMHRFSGADIPEAPIGHHWFDSTHITFGVGTVGMSWKTVKVEGSALRGREPDEDRWDIEAPEFDSCSARLSWNPHRNMALQASWGSLNEPEELEPGIDIKRTTVSASYNRGSDNSSWQTTAAWGRNKKEPGEALDAFLVESTLNLMKVHTVFARIERVKKDELFEEGSLAHEAFWVNKATFGFIHDFNKDGRLAWGLGALGSMHFVPEELQPFYEKRPLSFMLFARTKVR